MHRWILPSCGEIRPSSRRRDAEAPPPASPPKLRKVVSEGTLAVPKDVEEFLTMSAYGCGLKLFTYDDLRVATGDFDPARIVGEGGFGVVYRAFIDGAGAKGYPPAPKEVAVKELNPAGLQGDREWLVSHQSLRSISAMVMDDEFDQFMHHLSK